MALKSKPRRFWSRLHFLVRLLGLIGAVTCAVGLVIAGLNNLLLQDAWKPLYEAVRESVTNQDLAPYWALPSVERLATGLVVGGGVVALLVLIVEILNILLFVAGRRSLLGFNALFQVAVATVLLIAVNIYSTGIHLDLAAFDSDKSRASETLDTTVTKRRKEPAAELLLRQTVHEADKNNLIDIKWNVDPHYARIDTTNNGQFTLPADVKTDMARLQGTTKIVVYRPHRSFGQATERPNPYSAAAERKVVEKVQDVVGLFSELGPKFQVVVLDPENDIGYQEKLDAETKGKPALRTAIDDATENTIFFEADDKVQRLSFNDFYTLDKKASLEFAVKRDEAVLQRGNLVLRPQGFGPIGRRILNLEERKPRVGVLTVHQEISTQSEEPIGLIGLRKTLTSHGFEVRDIIAKKWGGGPPTPAVLTFDESKDELLESEQEDLEDKIKIGTLNRENYKKRLDELANSTLEELTKKFAADLGGEKMTEELRRINVEALRRRIASIDTALVNIRKERDDKVAERSGLKVEQLGERRRLTDLKAKLDRELADCDLLVIPRLTIYDVITGFRVPQRAHLLSDVQVEAIKDFMKSGKPVLACLGPTSGVEQEQFPGPESDQIEPLLADLGFRLNKQTVLFNVESRAFAARKVDLLSSGGPIEVPSVEFDWPPEAFRSTSHVDNREVKPNPIRTTMRLLVNTSEKGFDLRMRYPRPVGFDPIKQQALGYDPVFVVASAESWNDDDPFPSAQRVPHYDPSVSESLNPGFDAKRTGPFPVGVAVDVDVPTKWYKDAPSKRAHVRVAVIGSGSVFAGKDLTPASGALLLNTCNWLLGRDDLLPQDDRPAWLYPRVPLTEKEQMGWFLGAMVGLPGLFAFLGLVVLLFRQLR
jgi:hypothetical protein